MTWLRKNIWFVLLVALVAGETALWNAGKLRFSWEGRSPGIAGSGHGPEHGEEEGESHLTAGKVVLEAESFAASGIRTGAAAMGSVALNLQVTGEVQPALDRVVHVTPRIKGTIREVYKALGDEVARDAPLCSIESLELGEARSAFIASLAEKSLTERGYERWKQLYDSGLKNQNEFLAAETSWMRARIQLEAAHGKLKALGFAREEIAELEKGGLNAITNLYHVKSSLAGSILDQHATMGENVEEKDQLFQVADLSEVWVQGMIHIKDLLLARKGMQGVVRIQGLPSLTFKGQVTHIGQKVDERSRTVPLRISVRNEPLPGTQERYALRPGMFAAVDLETSRKEGILVVPLRAIQTVGGETVVFVQSALPPSASHGEGENRGPEAPADPGRGGELDGAVAFERRPVTLGSQDGEWVEVVRGLQAGETVAITNTFLLKSEFERSRISEGHAH